MNKKIIIIGVIIFVGILLFTAVRYVMNRNMQALSEPRAIPSAELQKRLMSSATVTVPEVTPETTIKLTGKTTEFGNINDRSKPVGTVTVGDTFVGDDNRIVTIITTNNTGSGDLYYLAGFEMENNAWTMTSSVFLGDRIQFDTLEMANDIVKVSYMDHTPEQAMVDKPTVPVNKQFQFSRGRLNEVK